MYSFRMSFWTVPVSAVGWHPLPPGHGDVEGEEDRRRGIDGHRRRHPIERNALEEILHVLQRRDGDPDLADLAVGGRRVGIVAHLRGQVEGHREPRLPLVEEESIALVGLGRRAESRVLPHGPEPRAIHARVDAARVGELAGRAAGGTRQRLVRARDRAPPRRGELRLTFAARSAHSGMFPCFLGGLLSRLVCRSVEGRAEARARVAGLDDLVDVAALGGHEGIGELLAVLADLLLAEGRELRRLAPSRDGTGCSRRRPGPSPRSPPRDRRSWRRPGCAWRT